MNSPSYRKGWVYASKYISASLRSKRGFTLIEVLLVVATIAILAGIVILAVNPARQVANVRNAERSYGARQILDAVYQSIAENGLVPSAITTTATEICKTSAGSCSAFIDLSELTNNGKYLVAIPRDPLITTGNGTGFTIQKDSNNRITVVASNAEAGVTISLNR